MIRITTPDLGQEELKEVEKVFDSGYLVQDKYVKEIENFITNYIGAKYTVVVSSGTAALHLSLIASGIKEKDEVIVPDFTFPATANVVELIGARPIFVDIDLNSLCIDPEKIEEKITDKTRAIIPVHEFGYPANMDEIKKTANKYNLKVIEDAACALGTKFKDKRVGTFGDVGCFSFHPRKSVTTGEGGVITTNNEEIYENLKLLRNHGIKNINGKIDFLIPGFNYRMTEIQAAIGIIQLKKLDQVIDRKREFAEIYNREFSKNDKIRISKLNKDIFHTYQSYHILLDEKIDRDEVIRKLKENEIESNYGAYALHELLYYKNKYGYKNDEFINSSIAFKKGLVLPLSYKMDKNDVYYIIETLYKIL